MEIIEAAKAVLPSLTRQQALATPSVITECLSMIAIDRPVKGKTADHWKAHISMFSESLCEFPADAVRAGAKDVINDAEIYGFPNVAQFRAKVEPHALSIRRAAYRAKRIAEAQLKPVRKPQTPEERQRVEDMLADLKRTLQAPADPKAKPYGQHHQMADNLRRMADRGELDAS